MAPPQAVAAAPQAGGAPGGAAPGQQQQQGGGFLQKILMYILIYFVMQQFIGPKKTTDPEKLTSNLFEKGEKVEFWLYATESEFFNDYGNSGSLVWHEEGVPYSTEDPAASRQLHWTYRPSEAVKNNGSLWGHAFFARSGYSPNPEDASFARDSVFSRTFRLNKYGIKPKVDRRVNLLGKSMNSDAELAQLDRDEAAKAKKEAEPEVEEEELEEADNVVWNSGSSITKKQKEEEEEPARPWVSFWRPNVTINLVDEHNAYPKGGVPAHLVPLLDMEPVSGNFFPPVFINDFWLLKDYLQPINDTTTTLELDFFLAPMSSWWWNLYVQLDQSFKMQASMGSMGDGEADEIKRVFIEGNPWLLGLTMIVSMFHTVFDFLAFKNDIQFWRNNKSMEGLSARTVIISFVSQVIVLLYLLDNETSWMIIISSAVGCVIEFWKIGKAMDISVGYWGSLPILRFTDKQSYQQNKTREYDEQATKYLSYSLFPLVGGYAIWSLFYQTHKSWYSWVVTSLTGCVYTFGFIMMTPQLFINYKLKSVAHLPWRQMTYKFLNTIIDDLFAFVIKMPLLHRLSVFRDDLVFLIFVYQLWIYPVDKKRVNEFGFGGEEALGAPPAEVAGPSLVPALPEGEVVVATESKVEETSVTRTAAGKVAEAQEEVPLLASSKSTKKTK